MLVILFPLSLPPLFLQVFSDLDVDGEGSMNITALLSVS